LDNSQVAKLVAVLMVSYPNARWMPSRPGPPGEQALPGTSTAYETMLRDLDYETANAAVERLLATKPQFPPTVAEIREAALALTVGETRPGGSAWGDVVKAIRRYGYMRSPGTDFRFADPLVAEAVSAMDWVELCSSENQVADRARFIELYDRLASTHRRSQLSESLPAVRQLRAKQELQRLDDQQARSIGQLVGEVLKRST
jgi:hypothetical protein